jgi:hypothetical protein
MHGNHFVLVALAMTAVALPGDAESTTDPQLHVPGYIN